MLSKRTFLMPTQSSKNSSSMKMHPFASCVSEFDVKAGIPPSGHRVEVVNTESKTSNLQQTKPLRNPPIRRFFKCDIDLATANMPVFVNPIAKAADTISRQRFDKRHESHSARTDLYTRPSLRTRCVPQHHDTRQQALRLNKPNKRMVRKISVQLVSVKMHQQIQTFVSNLRAVAEIYASQKATASETIADQRNREIRYLCKIISVSAPHTTTTTKIESRINGMVSSTDMGRRYRICVVAWTRQT